MNNWALSSNLSCWRPSLSKNGWLKGADYAEISNAYTPASQSHRPIILFLPCPNAYACLLTFVASLKPRIKLKLLLRLRLICVPMMSISVRVVTETHLKPQAAQAPAVRWSSYAITVMAELQEFVWEYLRALWGIKKYVKFSKKNTSPRFHSVLRVIWPLTLMKRAHLIELFISRFSTHILKQTAA